MDVGQESLGIRPTFSRQPPMGVCWRLREGDTLGKMEGAEANFSLPPSLDEKGLALFCSGIQKLTSLPQRSWFPIFWAGRGGN